MYVVCPNNSSEILYLYVIGASLFPNVVKIVVRAIEEKVDDCVEDDATRQYLRYDRR